VRLRSTTAVVSVVALAVVAPPGVRPAGAHTPGQGADPSADRVLNLALQGSRTVGYEGTQSVTIHSPRGVESERLHVVRGTNDRLVIQAGAGSGGGGWTFFQDGQRRVVMDPQGGAVSQGHAGLAADIEPDSSLRQMRAKYGVTLEGPTRMLDREAWTLRIERSGDARLVERWTVDARTGLVLGRDSYDPSGGVERSIVFTEVREPYTPPDSELEPPGHATAPPPASQRWFTQPEASRLAAAQRLPSSLPGSYLLRSGSSFKVDRASVVQLVYSDGLQEVSLFDQPGKLAGSWLPPGARRIKLRHGPGFAWEGFPRGTAWQAGPDTCTLVGASPADELAQMADSLPQAPFRRTLRQRLSHVVDWLRSRLT